MKVRYCTIGKCTNKSEYVWYNVHRVRGTKWNVCGDCYKMLGGKRDVC